MTMPDGTETEARSGTSETATSPSAEGQTGVVTTPAAQTTAAAPATDAPPAQGGNTVVLTSKTLKARLDKEKERGKRAALAEVESKARALGYSNADEMYKAIEEFKSKASTSAAEPAVPAQERQPKMANGDKNGNGKQPDSRNDRELERLRKSNEENEKQRRHAEKQVKLARKREEEARIEAQLARAAAQAGIHSDDDVDYAIHLLRSEVKRNPEKFNGTDTFDERSYFEKLRETKPHLFGEAARPSTTGVSVSGEQVPPKPGQVTTQVAKNGQFDARTASKEELAKEMSKRGLRFNL